MYLIVTAIFRSVQCAGLLDAKRFATTSAHTTQATTSDSKKNK